MPAPPPPPRSRALALLVGVVRFWWRPVLIVAVAGGLAAWIMGWRLQRARVEPSVPVLDEPAPEPSERRWTPRTQAAPAPGCAPRAERRCVQGDAWWFDGCGNAYEKADECDNARCDDGVCEPIEHCDASLVPGRCDGSVAESCVAGRPFRLDCAADGKRCVTTEDGPACRPITDSDCDWPRGTARCDGDVLTACVEGRLASTDCRIHGGTCEARAGGMSPRCVVRAAPRGLPECGACGCEPERGEEVCDGRDNDLDGWVDEDGGCEPVDVVALVVEDESGHSSWSDADIEEEIDLANAAFAREDDLGIELRLVQVLALRRPEWIEIDGAELGDLIDSGAIHPARDAFYLPIVFTDEVVVDEVPRPGLATVPNGVCGGIRRTLEPQTPVGLVALAKRHWPTTLAHEIGHFFGLCHTHAERADAVELVAADDATCGRACDLDADGICDTPPDPGPEVCRVDDACAIACDDGQVPDPANVMAYYPTCRNLFTPEQARLVRTSLWLRRQWHACVWGDGCGCDPRRGGCPEGMTCRNHPGEGGETRWLCGLEGASVPGGPCRSGLDCSRDSVCVITGDDGEGRCIRPCDDTTPDCDCREVDGFSLPLCIDDALALSPAQPDEPPDGRVPP